MLSRRDGENTDRVLADGFSERGRAAISASGGRQSLGAVGIWVWTHEKQVHMKTSGARLALFPLPSSTRMKEHP